MDSKAIAVLPVFYGNVCIRRSYALDSQNDFATSCVKRACSGSISYDYVRRSQICYIGSV